MDWSKAEYEFVKIFMWICLKMHIEVLKLHKDLLEAAFSATNCHQIEEKLLAKNTIIGYIITSFLQL